MTLPTSESIIVTMMSTANKESTPSFPGIPPELAVRLAGFAELGIDAGSLLSVARGAGPSNIPGSIGWANVCIERGDALSNGGDYLEASFWYFLARFPAIFNPRAEEAYALHRAAYERAFATFEYAVERVSIPFGDATYGAYLHRPGQLVNAPVVLVWGGVDVWKSDLEIHEVCQALAARGMAALAIDMPGTGESPVALSTDAEVMFFAAIDAVRRIPGCDGERPGVYGLSFGGHWAVKLALTDRSLAGVVNVGGPLHNAFSQQWISALPRGLRATIAKAARLDPVDDLPLDRTLSELSLITQGVLRPDAPSAPLLSINGDKDTIVPIADVAILSEFGIPQDRLIFGGDRHVASGNRALHVAFATEWLARHLACSRTIR